MLKWGVKAGVVLCTAMLLFHVPRSVASANAYKFYLEAQNATFMFKKVALYDKAIEMDAQFTDARKARATILYYQGKYRQAEEDLNYCVRAGKASKDDYFLLGKIYLAQKKYPEAEGSFSKVLAIDPQDRTALLERAKTRYLVEDFKGAWQDVRDIIRQGIEDEITDQAHKIAGFILLKSGKVKLAEENFKMANTPDDFAYGGFYGYLYDPRGMSFIGMVGLIVGVLVLLFKVELPPPRRRK